MSKLQQLWNWLWVPGTALGYRLAWMASVILVVVLALGLGERATRGVSGPEIAGHEEPSDASAAGLLECEGERAAVRLVATRVSPDEAVLRLRGQLCLPLSLRAGIRTRPVEVGDPGEAVQSTTPAGDDVVSERHARDPLVLRVKSEFPTGAASSLLALERLYEPAATRGGTSVTTSLDPLDVPLDGRSRDYPFDGYWLQSEVTLDLPPSLMLDRDGKQDIGIPVDLDVRVDPGVSGLRVGFGPVGDDPWVARLDVYARRNRASQLFVVGLLLVPLLLIVAFVSVRRASPASHGVETTAAIAAAMFAILPLRAVLVPGDINRITYVDWLLGIQVAILAAAAIRALRP